MSRLYCTECGFANAEAARYCTRCGALIAPQDPQGETQALSPEEIAEASRDFGEGMEGPALVVRAGGGRAGESFHPGNARTTIGRSPDCDIFLDDVTVSRRHAVLVREGDGTFTIEDEGSLNGTFLNRRRIDNAKLENGDELQIGKYKLTFVEK